MYLVNTKGDGVNYIPYINNQWGYFTTNPHHGNPSLIEI